MNTILLTIIATIFVRDLIAIIAMTILQNKYADIGYYISGGVLYWIIYAVCWPIREWNSYSDHEAYYRRIGISRWQYILLHKREQRGKDRNL